MHGSLEHAQKCLKQVCGSPRGANPPRSPPRACLGPYWLTPRRGLCLKQGDPKALELNSGRTALHKAAFWGHDHIVPWLLGPKCNVDPNLQDYNGDTALHDAARFGHSKVCSLEGVLHITAPVLTPHVHTYSLQVIAQLLAGGASVAIANKAGRLPGDEALFYGKR